MSRLPAQHLGLGGLALGLLISPLIEPPAGGLPLLPVLAVGVIALAARSRPRRRRLTALLVPISVLAGLLLGDARLGSIDAGALHGPAGEPVAVRGTISSLARRSDGEVRFMLSTGAGRVGILAREPVGELPLGAELLAFGELRLPEPWRAGELRRNGAALLLAARRLRLSGSERGGLLGGLDEVRGRAEEALTVGISAEQSALARGFVLGQDDGVDPATRERFRDSGLAHLLAVSGQNVVLLSILIGALLGLANVGLRLRLLVIALTVAAYVPIAGAGASIQRAGMMGVAGIVATLSSRPSDRAWVILLAAAGTLALNPRISGDVGWQLSFVAVIGIAAWSGLIRDLLLRGRDRQAQPRRAIADAIAVTLAATVATAPLLVHHFEALSLASLPANVLAMPAVAPVMWLGMLAGLLGQLPGIPLEPVTVPMGALISLIAGVAELLAQPRWASVELEPPSAAATALLYGGLLSAAAALRASMARRRGLGPPGRLPVAATVAAVVVAALVTLVAFERGPAASDARPADALRLTALDVGQGDAILLEPPRQLPILIDAGNPGSGVVDALEERGIDALAAIVATHGDLDHAGGTYDILDRFEVNRLLRGVRVPQLEAAARSAGVRVVRLAAGDVLELGRLRVDVLWPPPQTLPGAEPNDNSLILFLRWQGSTALLTGDAEFEAAGPDPPPADVLKVPHHGSADAGLGAALDRSLPAVALISVGADNDYGHPTSETLAELSSHDVCILRTDVDGDVSVDLSRVGVTVPSPEACS